MLTLAQMTTLANALRAESDPTLQGYLNGRMDVQIADWLNALSTTDSWKFSVDRRGLFEATNIAKFDNLTAGKRDAWKLMQDNSPIDFERQVMRNALVDIWGVADSVPVLTAMVEKASRVEAIFGGPTRTTNSIVAIARSFHGPISINEVSEALNRNP